MEYIEQRRLLASHGRPRGLTDLDLEIKGGTEDLAAQQPLPAGLGNGPFGTSHSQAVLRTKKEPTLPRAHCKSRDGHPFNDTVGIAFEQGAINGESRISSLAVADDIANVPGLLGNHGPLQTDWKSGPPPAPATRIS